MGLFSRSKPKIKVENKKKDGYSGWIKCLNCNELIHADELKENLNCCGKCNYHYRLSLKQRIELLCDEDSFKELFDNIHPIDSLQFVDTKSYVDRLNIAKEKSQSTEAVKVGLCKINDVETAIAILDFSFMGGSMGSVVGERITSIIEQACDSNLPLVIVSASGGARMQESILSLMQMAKTSAALTKLHEKKLPYISILTNPTTGGVTASFASLGDIIIAEPDALVAFAGPRVVEQTIKQKLPEGAQKSKFVKENGMIDLIVDRKDLKNKITFFIKFLTKNIRKSEDRFPAKLKQLLGFAEDNKKEKVTKLVNQNNE
ncbi:MAG: Acetyl-coenzyme A carboxylase carboxyl transferase subunit beta [Candidatus Anoxychlamydiales bacterium]|nr:Acetyl-coenzyme A carboxylase carboxyl transferase subunit beta [Candidatus Anoxychlamydiales bacterium]